jgi:hypothetical protein
MLERAGLVLAGPAFLLALPLPSPGTRLAPVRPALRDEDASQGADDSQASDDNRHPYWSGTHPFMMAAIQAEHTRLGAAPGCMRSVRGPEKSSIAGRIGHRNKSILMP